MHQLFTPVHFLFWQLGLVGGQFAPYRRGATSFLSFKENNFDVSFVRSDHWGLSDSKSSQIIWVFQNIPNNFNNAVVWWSRFFLIFLITSVFFQTFPERSKHTNYNWYLHHFHDVCDLVGCGCRIHRLHLCRGERLPQRVSCGPVGRGCRIRRLHLCTEVRIPQRFSWICH